MNLLNKKLLIIIGVLLFLGFVGFSYLVAKEAFTQLDFDLTVKFQDKIPHRFDHIFSWFSVMGSAEVTMIVWGGLLILMLIKKFWLTAASLFLLPLALVIEVYGKLFVHHPAPPFMFYRGVLDVNFPIHFTHTDFSYPSGHETRTAFLVVFLMFYFFYRVRKMPFLKNWQFQILIQSFLLMFLVVMSVSRVYLGEHWSSDVFGGFLIGVSFGILSGVTIPVKRKLEEKLTS